MAVHNFLSAAEVSEQIVDVTEALFLEHLMGFLILEVGLVHQHHLLLGVNDQCMTVRDAIVRIAF